MFRVAIHQRLQQALFDQVGASMLVRQFKFKHNSDRGGFQWMAHSEIERPGFYRWVHRPLADVSQAAQGGS